MLQILAIFAALVTLNACSFLGSQVGQDLIAGEEQVAETVIKDIVSPKNSVVPVTSSKK